MTNRPNKADGNILIVDDDSGILISAQLFLKQYFKKVFVELNPKKIKERFDKHTIDVVLLDMNFQKGENSGDGGFHYLKQILEINKDAIVIFMTAYGDIEMAVNALKAGATDFVTKPWRNEKLLTTIETAVKLSDQNRLINTLQGVRQIEQEKQHEPLSGFIGESSAFEAVKNTLLKVAPTDANLLFLGENGTGKSLAAQYVHLHSDRHTQPMISIDMGSLSDSLFESELFGHEKGSFTDAINRKQGRFELAHKSTLFLDEIGNLSLKAQAKLLAVLQNRTVTRLGSNKEMAIDVRVICASNMPLYKMVEEGTFRQDLLFRINTVEVTLPSLVDRLDDLAHLVPYFIHQFQTKYKKLKLSMADTHIHDLRKMAWPGNIRELQHAIERAVILSDGDQLTADDFNTSKATTSSKMDFTDLNLKNMEVEFIKRAIAQNKGNITHAAKALGIDRLALHRRLEKYDLQ